MFINCKAGSGIAVPSEDMTDHVKLSFQAQREIFLMFIENFSAFYK